MEYSPNLTPTRLEDILQYIDNELNKVKNSVNELYNSAHGSMYQYELGTVITISASNTYYPITGMSAGKLYGFTYTTDTLTVDKGAEGRYLVNVEASYSDGGNTNFEIGVLVNGTINQHSAAHASTTGSLNNCAAGVGLIDLVEGDTVQVGINNHTNTNNATIEHASLTLVQISQIVNN